MSLLTPPTLPLEIQELVITALFTSTSDTKQLVVEGGDFPILNECTFVSRAWLRVCRRLRFAKVQVNPKSNGNVKDILSHESFESAFGLESTSKESTPSFQSTSKFIDLLTPPSTDPSQRTFGLVPPVSSCIRSLVFNITNPDFFLPSLSLALALALRTLTNLNALTLRYTGSPELRGAAIDWKNFAREEVGKAFLWLITGSRGTGRQGGRGLRYLALCERMVRFPVGVLRKAGIRALLVQGTDIAFEGESGGVLDGPCPDADQAQAPANSKAATTAGESAEGPMLRLEEFHPISLTGEINQLLDPFPNERSPWLDLGEVKNLTMLMDSSPESVSATMRVLSSVRAPHMISLSVCENKSFNGLFSQIKHCFSTITDLRLTVTTNPPPLPITCTLADQLSALNDELQAMREFKHDNRIQALLLTFIHFAQGDHDRTTNSKECMNEWARMDEILLPSEDGIYWGSLRGVLVLAAGCGLTTERFTKLTETKMVAFQVHAGPRLPWLS